MNQIPKNGWNTAADAGDFTCHVCGNHSAHNEVVSDVFEVDGRRVLVENIPAMVCLRCGEPIFSRETGERVRKLVHDHRPVKTVPLDVFALA
jgi:HTH-type transcriptional regulator/antitoxin MqsA